MLDSGLCYVAFENWHCVVWGLTSTRSIFGTKAIQHIFPSPKKKNLLVGSDDLNEGQHLLAGHHDSVTFSLKGLLVQFLITIISSWPLWTCYTCDATCAAYRKSHAFTKTHAGVEFNCWTPRLCPATGTQTVTGVNQDKRRPPTEKKLRHELQRRVSTFHQEAELTFYCFTSPAPNPFHFGPIILN